MMARRLLRERVLVSINPSIYGTNKFHTENITSQTFESFGTNGLSNKAVAINCSSIHTARAFLHNYIFFLSAFLVHDYQ